MALKDAGYTRVTLLEREAEPGGKCKTYRQDGHNWELGAILGMSDYKGTLDLMARAGMKPYRAPKPSRLNALSGPA